MLVIYGRTLDSSEGNDGQSDPKYKQEEIGWAAVQFFNYEGCKSMLFYSPHDVPYFVGLWSKAT
jgi:hypothetical protein